MTKPPGGGIHRQCGYVLITMVLSMAILLAFVGLAIDVGYLDFFKIRMQTAADAAALGGVQELRMNGPSTIVTAAKGDAALNGFTDGVNNVTITVNHPPLNGDYMNDATAVEAIISQNAPTFFMQALGFSSMTIKARGVARQGSNSTCVYVLDPNATKALKPTGSGQLISHCGMFVNSNDSKAVYQTGSGSINTTPAQTDIVGGYYQTGTSSITPAPVTGVPSPVVDPFASRTMPGQPGGCNWVNKSVSGTTTLNPGVYCGGLSITGSGTITLNQGLYTMDGGGFNVTGSGSVNGSGITIFLTADATYPNYKGISINGSGTYTLTAPTSGTYESFLFIGSRTTASSLGSTITGSSKLLIDGVVYLPEEALTFTGSGIATNYQVVVSDTLTTNGSGTTYINNNYSGLASGAPIKGSGLVAE